MMNQIITSYHIHPYESKLYKFASVEVTTYMNMGLFSVRAKSFSMPIRMHT